MSEDATQPFRFRDCLGRVPGSRAVLYRIIHEASKYLKPQGRLAFAMLAFPVAQKGPRDPSASAALLLRERNTWSRSASA